MEDFQSIEIDLRVTSLLAETKPPGGFCLLQSLKLAVTWTDECDSNSMEMAPLPPHDGVRPKLSLH